MSRGSTTTTRGPDRRSTPKPASSSSGSCRRAPIAALTRLPGMTHLDERIEALTLWGGTAPFHASVSSLRAPLDDWIGGLEGEEIRLPSGTRAVIVTSGSPMSDSIYAEAGPDTAVAIHYSTTSVSRTQAAAILDSVRPPRRPTGRDGRHRSPGDG